METLAYAAGGAVTGFALFYAGLFLSRWISGTGGTHAYTYVVEDFERKLSELQGKLKDLVEARAVQERQLTDCRNESYLAEQRFRGLIEAKENVIKGLESRLDGKSRVITDLEKDIDAKNEQINSLASSLQCASSEREAMMTELEESREESSRLESAYEAQTDDLARAHDRIEELTESERGLVVQVSLLKTKLAEVEKERDSLHLSLADASEALENIQELSSGILCKK